jgi:hypothetical protein
VVLEGGTLTSSAGTRLPLLVPPVLGRVGNVVGSGGRVVGTLLGPERADPAGGVASGGGRGSRVRAGLHRIPLSRLWPGGLVGWGGRCLVVR